MKLSDNVYFTVDTIDNYFNLPNYFLNTYEQFFSTFHAFNVHENDKFIRYEVNAIIERDYKMNKYVFYQYIIRKMITMYCLIEKGAQY